MTQSLARYHARSPRYTLNTEDNSLIRVAGANQLPWEEGTDIRNVSLTGLAFTAPSDLCPILGEVIRIQFVAPGGKQMATHALVTRIDSISKDNSLVAVHFYKMEMGHRVALAQGLSKRFKDSGARSRIDIGLPPMAGFRERIPSAVFMIASATLWLEFYFLINRFSWGTLFGMLKSYF